MPIILIIFHTKLFFFFFPKCPTDTAARTKQKKALIGYQVFSLSVNQAVTSSGFYPAGLVKLISRITCALDGKYATLVTYRSPAIIIAA